MAIMHGGNELAFSDLGRLLEDFICYFSALMFEWQERHPALKNLPLLDF